MSSPPASTPTQTTTKETPPTPFEAARLRGVAKGTYLAELREELTWYQVGDTNTSYLIRASDAPSSTETLESSDPPIAADLVMIVKVVFSHFPTPTRKTEMTLRSPMMTGGSDLRRTGGLRLYHKTLKKRSLPSRKRSSPSLLHHPRTTLE